MHNILVIAQGTVVRQLRNKVLYLLILVCLCLVGVGSLYRILSLETEAKLMRDLGLAGISLIGMVIAVFIGSNEVGKELREGTLDALLAKPLGRDEFILGKYLGTLFVALINIAIITVGFLIIMSFYEGSLRLDLIRAVVLNVFEVSVIISVAIFFTTFLPEAVSAVITFLIFVIGHGAHMLLLVSERTEMSVPRIAAKVLFYLIPNLHHFNIRAAVGHELAIPGTYVGYAVIYGLCYTGMALCLSVLVFRRREL